MNFTGDQKNNVFVPSYAPQFVKMRDAGGIPGVSLEDSNRVGVWVPLEWLNRSERRP